MWNEISSVITDIGHCSKFSTLLLLPFEVFFLGCLTIFFFSFHQGVGVHCTVQSGLVGALCIFTSSLFSLGGFHDTILNIDTEDSV